MGTKRSQRKPIIFGNCKEVLKTVIMIYFAVNLVFGGEEEEEESEFCKRGWFKFVQARKQWEGECLNDNVMKISSCCNETADYLKKRYEDYIKLCPIVGMLRFEYRGYLVLKASLLQQFLFRLWSFQYLKGNFSLRSTCLQA